MHADDAGMCHSVNEATIEALTKGMVSSASIMVPCPWFPEFAAWAKQHPEMDLGIHLTLTSEWQHYRWRPVAPAASVKGLFDPEGYMWRSEVQTAKSASAQEVETELRAQIERAREFGVAFTHFDTHMGTMYTRPDYFDVYAKLAREYKVPCMIPRPSEELRAPEDSDHGGDDSGPGARRGGAARPSGDGNLRTDPGGAARKLHQTAGGLAGWCHQADHPSGKGHAGDPRGDGRLGVPVGGFPVLDGSGDEATDGPAENPADHIP